MQTVGFEDFRRKASEKYAGVLSQGSTLLTTAHGMYEQSVKDTLCSLIRSACITVTNSFQSVLLLTMNGCGSDALKIARSMFETSVVMTYLQKHPNLLADFLDYRWIKRNKHQEFLSQYAPDELKRIDPAEVVKTVAEYGRVKSRFKGRSSWNDKKLPCMAKDVGLEQQYLAVYPFTSSVHHLDVIGIMAQEDDGISDIEVLPSGKNLDLALSIAGLSAYVAVAALDEALGAKSSQKLADWSKQYRASLSEADKATGQVGGDGAVAERS